jgi:two-component system, NtrC family, sensor kinase
VESAQKIFDGMGVHIALVREGRLELQAVGSNLEFESARKDYPMPVDRNSSSGMAVLERRVVNVADVESGDAPRHSRANTIGFRSLACVPLMRQGEPIGVISVSRKTPGALNDKQVDLLRTFADQAVIAIENARLFNETKEALEQQTATAEILKVISGSPTDVQPVFDAIVRSGLGLFPNAAIGVALPDGDQVRAAAIGTSDPALMEAWKRRFPFPLKREYMHGLAILERRLVDIPDAEAEKDGPLAQGIANFLASGYRALTIAPMMRGGDCIGAISVLRLTAGALSGRQLQLLKTFADQAVIAIENVRLFNETKEALERQTATGEILKAIAASPSDVQPVFDTIVETSKTLLGGHSASVLTVAAGPALRRA